jgi:hypothetical protein
MKIQLKKVGRFGGTWLAVAVLAALSACSDNNNNSTSPSNLSGQIVKGPVGSSKVCLYAITSGVKAAAPLVPCTTSDASGNYSFTAIAYAGDVFIEATGGTFKNEATGAISTLTTPLGSIVALSGGNAVGMVTPLTQVAVSVSTSFDSAAMAQAASNIAAQAGLGALDIRAVAPTFAANSTTATNAYAAILGAIAEYSSASAGSTLDATLAAWKANTAGFQAALQAALSTYAAKASVSSASLPSSINLAATGAATSVSASVGTGASTVSSTAGLTASSSLTLTGGGAGFTPLVGQGLVVAGSTTINLSSGLANLAVSVDSGGMDVLFHDAAGKEWRLSCTSQNCGGAVTVDGAGKKVTFNNATLTADRATPATGTVVVNGSANYL